MHQPIDGIVHIRKWSENEATTTAPSHLFQGGLKVLLAVARHPGLLRHQVLQLAVLAVAHTQQRRHLQADQLLVTDTWQIHHIAYFITDTWQIQQISHTRTSSLSPIPGKYTTHVFYSSVLYTSRRTSSLSPIPGKYSKYHTPIPGKYSKYHTHEPAPCLRYLANTANITHTNQFLVSDTWQIQQISHTDTWQIQQISHTDTWHIQQISHTRTSSLSPIPGKYSKYHIPIPDIYSKYHTHETSSLSTDTQHLKTFKFF